MPRDRRSHRRDRDEELLDDLLTYVDFPPAKNATFSDLMGEVNLYLETHQRFKVKSCEGYVVEGDPETGDGCDASTGFMEYGDKEARYTRCLRLWMEPRTSHERSGAQILACTTAVPRCTYRGNASCPPRFKTFKDTIDDFNLILEQEPLQGRILNVDTWVVRFQRWTDTFDPDQLVMEEKENLTYHLTVLKVFYVVGKVENETIGFKDFVPECKKQGSWASTPAYEYIQAVAKRANTWIKVKMSDVRVITVKTEKCRFKPGGCEFLDKDNPLRWHTMGNRTDFLNIVRVYFVYAPYISPRRAIRLSYRTVSPALTKTSGMLGWPQYENQVEHKERVVAYANYTGARVINAETVQVRVHDHKTDIEPEKTLDHLTAHQDYCVNVIRIWMDGYYKNPKSSAMPPLPYIEDGGGMCAII